MGNELFSKKFIGFVGLCTALVIFVCYLFFDLRIVRLVQTKLGLWHPSITIVVNDGDDVLSAEQKLWPMFNKRSLEYAVAVYNPEKISLGMVNTFQVRGTELIYMPVGYGNKNSDKVPASTFQKLFRDYKQRFADRGLEAGYLIYPYAWKAEKFMKPAVAEEFQAGIANRYFGDKWWKNARQFVNNGKTDKVMLWATGYGFRTAISLEQLQRAVDLVEDANGWGIMVLTTKGKYMTPEAFDAVEQMLDYAKTKGVEIVPLREGLRRFRA